MATAVRVPSRLPGDQEPFPSVQVPGNQVSTAAQTSHALIQELNTNKSGDGSTARLRHPQIAVGGHRGNGQNRWVAEVQQYTGPVRENTLHSFDRAARAGASFIEFDVQVTKDGVPVIWHDDHVVLRSPAGEHSHRAIKQLDLSEFKDMHTQQIGRASRGAGSSIAAWRCEEEHELPMLNEVFRHIPESVGFDIEVKMTTPDTEAATSPEEVDRVVSAILAEVREWEALSYRRLIFSTFDPDVALALKQRQSSIPVLFLSDGEMHHTDARRNGLATAVGFAADYGMDGVVLESRFLGQQPELVARALKLGLHVLTYGTQNDDPAWVLRQEAWGVHAAIVDDVGGVVKGIAP